MNLGLQYRVEPAHVLVAYRQSQRWLWRSPQVRRRMRWATLSFWVFCGLLGAWSASFPNSDGKWALLAGAAFVLIGVYQWLARRAVGGALADSATGACGERSLTVNDNGLTIEYVGGRSELRWCAIKAIETVEETILLRLDSYAVLPIPCIAFADPAERSAFVAEVTERIGQVESVSVSGLADTSGSITGTGRDDLPGEEVSYLSALRGNLAQGVRLAFFRRLGPAGLQVSWAQFVGLVGCGLVLRSLIDIARLGGHAEWTSYALPNAVFHVPVFLLAVWALAQLAGRPRQTLELLIAVVALSIPIDLLWSALAAAASTADGSRLFLRWGVVMGFLPFLWLAFAAAVGVVRLCAMERRRWLAAGALTAVILIWPLAENEFARSLWREAYDENSAAQYQRKHMALTGEDAFYLQPRLLERELSDIAPGTPGRVELFFVGVAGDANQDVFMKEVRTVRSLFVERFGTEGRSAALINNAQSVANAPIASVTALEQTLSRLGKAMNRDEDILFLFLTSHGSREHRFQLNFWPMRFNSLDPRRLRQALDDSGIKRRVVVVSACYSGGYIDALRDENTVVITAAAADKTSFGCSNEAEMTEFGQAYFAEALRKTDSFIEAFELARQAVATREAKEGRDPSNPQMAVGEGARQALLEWQEQRQDKALRGVAAASAGESLPSAAKHAKYDEMLDLFEIDQRARHLARLCREELAVVGPERMVAKQPDYYGGLGPKSLLWNDLLAVWARYEDETCHQHSDALTLRETYRKALGTQLGEREVDAALQWFRSPSGARWLSASNRAETLATESLSQQRNATNAVAIQRLQADMARVIEAFQRENARRDTKRGQP